MPVEYTDLTHVAASSGARSADFNTLIDNVEYLADPPRAALRRNTIAGIDTATDTAINWSLVWDSHGDMYDAGSPSRLLITRPGVYHFVISVLWEENNDGRRAVFVEKNGVRLRGAQQVGASPAEQVLVVETNAAAGDYFEVVVRQTSGVFLQVQPARTVWMSRWVAMAPVSGE